MMCTMCVVVTRAKSFCAGDPTIYLLPCRAYISPRSENYTSPLKHAQLMRRAHARHSNAEVVPHMASEPP